MLWGIRQSVRVDSGDAISCQWWFRYRGWWVFLFLLYSKKKYLRFDILDNIEAIIAIKTNPRCFYIIQYKYNQPKREKFKVLDQKIVIFQILKRLKQAMLKIYHRQIEGLSLFIWSSLPEKIWSLSLN